MLEQDSAENLKIGTTAFSSLEWTSEEPDLSAYAQRAKLVRFPNSTDAKMSEVGENDVLLTCCCAGVG